VAGCCECGDEPSGPCAMELVIASSDSDNISTILKGFYPKSSDEPVAAAIDTDPPSP
jgi:hypothetical protein